MARGDADKLIVGERGLDKDLRDRLSILGEVVIAKGPCRIGVTATMTAIIATTTAMRMVR
jgi:hypothetical protein